MDERDFELIARVVRNGWATMDEIEKCREIQKSTPSKWLGDLLLENGYIIREQHDGLKDLAASRKFHIPGYRFIGKLGSGGMAVVYKAVQISIDRPVAVKILPPRRAADATDTQRFIREVKALGQLSHPNIVAALDAGEINGVFYCVMEYVEGEGLDARIERLGKLPEAEALALVEQVARALDHAWQHGYVHRDIKPANILISRENVVKLTDLGIAKSQSEEDPGLTQTGTTVGSPLYISPEQARGDEVDIGADIYSLGITLFQLITGKPPFSGTTMEVVAKHVTQPVPSPKEFAPGVTDDVCALIARMTAKSRDQRQRDPAHLIEDIRLIREGKALTPMAQPRAATRATKTFPSARTARTAIPRRAKGPSMIPWAVGLAAAGVGIFLIFSAIPHQRPISSDEPETPAEVRELSPAERDAEATTKKNRAEAVAVRFDEIRKSVEHLVAAIQAGPPPKSVPDLRIQLRKLEKDLGPFMANPDISDQIKEKVLLAKQQLAAADKDLDAILQREIDHQKIVGAFAELEKKYPWLHKGLGRLPLPSGMRNTTDERRQLTVAREDHIKFLQNHGGKDPDLKGRAERAVDAIDALLTETAAEEERQRKDFIAIVADVDALRKAGRYEEALAKGTDAATRYGGRPEINAAVTAVRADALRYYEGLAEKAAKDQQLKEAVLNYGRQYRFASTEAERAPVDAALRQIRQRVAAEIQTRSLDIRKAYVEKRYGAAKKIAADTRANDVYADYWGVMNAVIDECAAAEKTTRTPEQLTTNATKWNKSIIATEPTFGAILSPILARCAACVGQGTTACPTCKNGRAGTCAVCKGNRNAACPTCDGKGEVDHELCKGGKEKHQSRIKDPGTGKMVDVKGFCKDYYDVLYRVRYLPMKEDDVQDVNIDGVLRQFTKPEYLQMLKDRYGVCKSGHIECKTCQGRKTSECASCGGTGLNECAKCSGTGRAKCAKCLGAGFGEKDK